MSLPDTFARGSARTNSCMAGDAFSPHGVWDQILADMGKK